jgi:hypothetical protein
MDEVKKWLPISSTTRYNITQLKSLIYQVMDNMPIISKKNEMPKPKKIRKMQR